MNRCQSMPSVYFVVYHRHAYFRLRHLIMWSRYEDGTHMFIFLIVESSAIVQDIDDHCLQSAIVHGHCQHTFRSIVCFCRSKEPILVGFVYLWRNHFTFLRTSRVKIGPTPSCTLIVNGCQGTNCNARILCLRSTLPWWASSCRCGVDLPSSFREFIRF